MEKYNGKKLDLIIMAGHLQMHNYEAIRKMQLRETVWQKIAVWLVISLMISLTLGICGGAK
jgi:uncharacterized protein (DUF983 family)